MLSDSVINTIISTTGGFCLAYLATVAQKKVQTTPKDRFESIFDGYEKLIKQQQDDIVQKQAQIEQTNALVEKLQAQLEDTKKIIERQKGELDTISRDNDSLIGQLKALKQSFEVGK